MKTDMNDPAAVEQRLWEDIERHQIGMLGLLGRLDHHTQPMTAFVERDARTLWFFTSIDSGMAKAVAEGAPALFTFNHKEIQASISGVLDLVHDEARIAEYWNAVAAAWRPGGKDDPRLTLLRLDCREAEVWLSQAGPVQFAWEIAVANVRKHEPHLGGHANLRFH
ncbi:MULTISPECIES: pyridoxamine 5'-phosphate oxidase family protein [Phenylobacterium]|uniref:General stress protein 26 n=1 Tax=Phenylobacterium koreense TaxID=266125 RepID=A0ABV2EHJ6_9CAUL